MRSHVPFVGIDLVDGSQDRLDLVVPDAVERERFKPLFERVDVNGKDATDLQTPNSRTAALGVFTGEWVASVNVTPAGSGFGATSLVLA